MDFLTTPLVNTQAPLLRAKLDHFARLYKEEVVLHEIPWENYWRELVNVSVHGLGADVAEIGSTWVEPLIAMNALAPFSWEDINSIGGKQSFFPVSWRGVIHDDSLDAWGIPARIDMRMIYYWQDMFETAEVDPRQAFSSPAALIESCSKLQHSVKHPWAVITEKLSHNLVYNLASWVWAEGGDFISRDGKKLLIDTEEFRRGVKNYYDLFKFMPPECRDSTNDTVLRLFAERKIAATIQGPWLITYLEHVGITPTMLNLVKITTPPGPPFVGGTVFVRWKHSRKTDLAGKLIRTLCEKDFNLASAKATGLLPSHRGVWNEEFLSENKYNPEYLKGLQNGRCLPPVRLWGMVEDRLAQAFRSMWEDLYALDEQSGPEAVEEVLAARLEPLALRLEATLNVYHKPPA
jgi:multiple sugar transport system substrate-binding protein